ncbi:hypothetical protein, unlikely [Trypanosoma brucei gambiense DAL972]|uniref:Uncharacterized protein n=1 Tax=Trypanosoma brucei gambiense (strain MHOM/CI/86/DAL972) TaxID=679716 RepID=D0A033_TRYB9|nr:hypothetical protein, unlikely [Trypanosoma brucei gambiense DAL972]CBH16591.1 hypothetical protein, unlikely [Trypanosoma brucei gambiense DAL972]|eukprot:XP_011778855.1 hypothetical protein, unlikely [Trypanosoma brucei gambiense DAL972]
MRIVPTNAFPLPSPLFFLCLYHSGAFLLHRLIMVFPFLFWLATTFCSVFNCSCCETIFHSLPFFSPFSILLACLLLFFRSNSSPWLIPPHVCLCMCFKLPM